MLATLTTALLLFAPSYVDDATAPANVTAALAAAQETGVSVDLILAIAYTESRFDPLSLSRLECSGETCKRVTGHYKGEKPPPKARPSWYCGVMQVGGDVPWEACQGFRTDLASAYLAGAQHLRQWTADPACRGFQGEARLRCGLQGYSGGYAAIKANAHDYVNAVTYQAARLRRLLKEPNS